MAEISERINREVPPEEPVHPLFNQAAGPAGGAATTPAHAGTARGNDGDDGAEGLSRTKSHIY